MSKGDFHTHSTHSDGVRSPTELIDLAYKRGVRVMALTDHDTLDGLEEAEAAAARHPGFLLVPGVELSCDVPGTEVHMLGYFIDRKDARLQEQLDSFREGRIDRAQRIIGALERLGAPIEWERVQELAGEASVGRPHIAQALLEAGHIEHFNEAFDRFIGRDGPAYAERVKLEPPDAIAMIRDAGGLAVFAHPGFTKEYERVARELADAGLFGLEAYYKNYDPEVVASLVALADGLGIFALGGSDHHGIDREGERQPGDIPLPDEVVDAFLETARERGCNVPEPTP
ncbi:MAG: PHP domain-containing protein [Chloroflexota bacterium]|nr:PHP domain-containing protein [Chloroflexota bacterium]MDE2694949.1 PHP domain-containing protein [Chloroflexota bacterium]